MRYQLTDHEWVAIKPMLPNKPRGVGNFLSPSLMRAGTGRPTRWAYPGQGPFGRAPGRDRSDRHNPSSTRNFDFLDVHRHEHRPRSDFFANPSGGSSITACKNILYRFKRKSGWF